LKKILINIGVIKNYKYDQVFRSCEHGQVITGGRSSTSVNGDIAIQWEWSNFDHS